MADGSDDVDLEVSVTFNNGQVNKTGAGKLAFTGSHVGSYDITIGAGTVEVGGAARLNRVLELTLLEKDIHLALGLFGSRMPKVSGFGR